MPPPNAILPKNDVQRHQCNRHDDSPRGWAFGTRGKALVGHFRKAHHEVFQLGSPLRGVTKLKPTATNTLNRKLQREQYM